ncbi:MAG: winged helix DNA-binding domain-containing protein [Thaumarchaeota archaeon]|nr:winged helix DNA-binding domain-containing protein [Nitrososphaerota archaeon]
MLPRPGIEVSEESARRLAVTNQSLAGKSPRRPGAEQILQVVRDIGCLQLDPNSAVAPSHQTVLWSRLGRYKLSDLDRLLWRDRKLFRILGAPGVDRPD